MRVTPMAVLFAVALLAVTWNSSSARAQGSPASAGEPTDCDRLISVLQQNKAPPQAHVTLEQTQGYRKGAQYVACRDALAQAALGSRTSREDGGTSANTAGQPKQRRT